MPTIMQNSAPVRAAISRLELLYWGITLFLCSDPLPFVFQHVNPYDPFSLLKEKSLYIYVKIAAIIPVVWRAWPHREKLARVARQNLPGILLVLFALLSSIWSLSPYLAARSALDLGMTFFVCVALVALYRPEDLVSLIASFLRVAIVMCVIWVVFVPDQGIHHGDDVFGAPLSGDFRGVYIHKNVLGQFMALSAIFFYLKMKPLTSKLEISLDHVFFALSLILLYFSKCMSGVIVVAFGMLFMAFLQTKGILRTGIAASIVLLALLYLVFASDFNEALFALLGRDSTFTGRTQGWAYIMTLVKRRWLLGYGFNATGYVTFRMMLTLSVFGAFVDSHNGYLDFLVGLGVMGLGFFVWWCAAAFSRGFVVAESEQSPTIKLFCILMAAWLMAAMVEVGPFGSSSPVSMTGYLAVFTLGAVHGRRKLSRPKTAERAGHLARA
jgi:exopolysaccharide production protein ExoQ